MVVGPVSCPLPVCRRPMPSSCIVQGRNGGKVRLVRPFNVSPVAITVMATFTATANNKNNNGNHFAARRKYANIREKTTTMTSIQLHVKRRAWMA